MSLRELAERLGWDRGRLSKYETNTLGLTLPLIEEIAKALEMRTEVVVLECLMNRYPSLKSSEVGKHLKRAVNCLEGKAGKT